MKINKNILLLFIGLIGMVGTLIANSTIENDLICIIVMIIFLGLEILGLHNIIKNKYKF